MEELEGEVKVQPLDVEPPFTRDVLESANCYVLDSGSEVYAWSGKQSSFQCRRSAVMLAEVRQESDIPSEGGRCQRGEEIEAAEEGKAPSLRTFLSFLILGNQGVFTLSLMRVFLQEVLGMFARPSWTPILRVMEGVETILFKEKFKDWIDKVLLRIPLQQAFVPGTKKIIIDSTCCISFVVPIGLF